MSKLSRIISVLLILSLLTACGTTPGETTAPTTVPVVANPVETTLPPATEPPVTEPTKPIPETHVCLNDLLEGSDITITVEGNNIYLDEDGLVLRMSTTRMAVFRDKYIVGHMEGYPITWGDKVYIHSRFFPYFFCKEGINKVSLFYSIDFYGEEILSALEDPFGSAFNAKLCAEVLLPQSMGITTPHVNMGRVFDDRYFYDAGSLVLNDMKRYGYDYYYLNADGEKEYYVMSEYYAILDGQTCEKAGISWADDPSMLVGEYERLREKEMHQEYYDEYYPAEELAFFFRKEIHSSDSYNVQRWFGDDFMLATDEALRELIETHYLTNLDSLADPISPETTRQGPTSATTAEIEAMNAYFEGMDERAIKEWFFEFNEEYHVYDLPEFPFSVGSSADAGEFLPWILSMNWDAQRKRLIINRTTVEQLTEDYFGVTLGQNHTLPDEWMYNRKTGNYFFAPSIYGYSPDSWGFYLLDGIEITEGICTIHATQYYSWDNNLTLEQQKEELLRGNTDLLTAYDQITVSFKINPETMEPIFCGFVVEHPD